MIAPTSDTPRLTRTLALRVVVPFAAGYFISFLLRSINAVIAPNLMDDLRLGAADLGLLTSTFFFAFALFQLPLGVLLDRFGPRRTESMLLMVAAAGGVVFSVSDTVGGLMVGRALLGLGVSACLMAAFTAFVLWFPGDRLPLINGVQLSAGGMGALAATQPVEFLLGFTDWRGLFIIAAALTTAVAILLFLAVPDRPRHGPPVTLADQWRGVAKVFTSGQFWRIAPLTVFSQGAFLSIQSLWSGPWLRDVAGFDRGEVAAALFLIACGVVAGFLGFGTIAERLGRRGIKTSTISVAGMIIFTAVQVAIALQWTGAALPLWILFGFFGTTGILMYPVLSRTFPAALAGRVNTGINLLVFLNAFAVQWAVGAIVDLWPASTAGAFAPQGYAAAFAGQAVLQVAGLFWYWLFRSRRLDPIR